MKISHSQWSRTFFQLTFCVIFNTLCIEQGRLKREPEVWSDRTHGRWNIENFWRNIENYWRNIENFWRNIENCVKKAAFHRLWIKFMFFLCWIYCDPNCMECCEAFEKSKNHRATYHRILHAENHLVFVT